MKHSVRKGLVGAIAASSVLALSTAPANATGQSPATTQAITLTNSGSISVKDGSTGWAIVCTASTGTGTAQVGTPQPNPVFQINTLQFNQGTAGSKCSTPFTPMQVTAAGLPWSFSATSPTVSGVTPGTLTGVKLTIVGDDNCHTTITGPGGAGGTISGKYTNGAGTLSFGGTGSTSNLTVATADINCDPTSISVGDPISLNGTYKINPSVVITYP
ncbi:hypothetical protein AB0L06_20935 [Spirillospora sp. NPDC052269]